MPAVARCLAAESARERTYSAPNGHAAPGSPRWGAPLGRLMTLVEHTGAKERSGEVLDVAHDGRHDSGGVGQCIAPKVNRKSLILMPPRSNPKFRLRRPPSPLAAQKVFGCIMLG